MKTKKWLLILYQIPAKSDSDRVRIWRNLQKIGAVNVKNSVSAVPDNPIFRRAIMEVAKEILSCGGEAIVTEGEFLFGLTGESLNQTFTAQVDAEYKSLAQEIREATKEISKNPTANELMKWEHKRTKFKSRLGDLDQRLITPTTDGRDLCQNSIDAFEKRLKGPPKTKLHSKIKAPKGATWVTRKNLHVDRLASAWLIKKYIDPEAKFLFVDIDEYKHSPRHIRFDVFNGEFTHVEDMCTFEILVQEFKIKNASIKALAEVIHDLDIEDRKYERKETEGIRMALEGIIRGHKDDQERLKASMFLLDSLVLSLTVK